MVNIWPTLIYRVAYFVKKGTVREKVKGYNIYAISVFIAPNFNRN